MRYRYAEEQSRRRCGFVPRYVGFAVRVHIGTISGGLDSSSTLHLTRSLTIYVNIYRCQEESLFSVPHQFNKSKYEKLVLGPERAES